MYSLYVKKFQIRQKILVGKTCKLFNIANWTSKIIQNVTCKLKHVEGTKCCIPL